MKIQKRNLYLALFLVVQILLMRWAANHPSFIETYYSNGLYPIISSFFRILLGWIPFSIGDLLIFYFVFYALRFIYRLFKTRFKGFLNKILGITAFCSIIYFCFYLFWGLNYYREPLSKNLGYEKTKYSTEELLVLSNHLVDNLNRLQLQIATSDTLKIENPYSQSEMYDLARKGYDSLATKLPQFNYRFGTAKSSLMSLIQSYNGTSGYLNPLTGEAHVNSRIPKTSFPTTTCHEMAHQIGFAAENEANFVGFLAALHNDDVYFQYAAYRMATRYAIFELYKRDPEQYKTVFRKMNKGIIKDFRASSEFWKAYENPFEPLMKKGYNAYLKSNNQSKGVQSYNYVVDLFISYYKDEINQYRTDFYKNALQVDTIPDSIPISFKDDLVKENQIIHRGVFTPDLKEYYFTLSDKEFKKFDVYCIQNIHNEWSAPKPAFFNSNDNEHGMSFSSDGNTLYFSSTRSVDKEDVPKTWHLWKSEKVDGLWTTPSYIEIPNLKNKLLSHPTVSDLGTLYFHASNLDYSDMSIYVAKQNENTFENAKKVTFPNDANNPKTTPYISPNEEYLIFANVEQELNLMISHQKTDGTWSEAIKLDKDINQFGQGNPYVTPDQQFLFYAKESPLSKTWSINWVRINSELENK